MRDKIGIFLNYMSVDPNDLSNAEKDKLFSLPQITQMTDASFIVRDDWSPILF